MIDLWQPSLLLTLIWFLGHCPQTQANPLALAAPKTTIFLQNSSAETRLQFVGTAGVASVALPETAPALELGKKYQWVFSYICNPDNSAEDAVVRGYIERVALSPEATQQLRAATTPEERLVVYAQNGLWYDTITLLGKLLLAEPDKFQADWEALLRLPVISLEEIATEPIVEEKRPE